MIRTLRFIRHHPLTRDNQLAALTRFARWQLASRARDEVVLHWFSGARLAVRRGMRGATGNIYCGLHEFADMAFVLHLLRPGDLFVDAGANVGSFTVIASAICGAEAVSVEPDPVTMGHLRRNIEINGIEARVTPVPYALGSAAGSIRFTRGRDTTNRVARDDERDAQELPVRTLDEVLDGRSPVLIKLDVEGHEREVLEGATATLDKPSLVAIESESENDHVVGRLAQAGFSRWYYDPFERALSERSSGSAKSSNALFLRNVAVCLDRVREAPRHEILGRLL